MYIGVRSWGLGSGCMSGSGFRMERVRFLFGLFTSSLP